jgi:hypothetical protein
MKHKYRLGDMLTLHKDIARSRGTHAVCIEVIKLVDDKNVKVLYHSEKEKPTLVLTTEYLDLTYVHIKNYRRRISLVTCNVY